MLKSFTVTFDVPRGVSMQECKEHIKDAVSSWGGSYDPDDAFFHLNDVKVTTTKKTKQP